MVQRDSKTSIHPPARKPSSRTVTVWGIHGNVELTRDKCIQGSYDVHLFRPFNRTGTTTRAAAWPTPRVRILLLGRCVGRSLYYFLAVLISERRYYCFEFLWISRGLSLARRVRHIEERWGYYLAFGAHVPNFYCRSYKLFYRINPCCIMHMGQQLNKRCNICTRVPIRSSLNSPSSTLLISDSVHHNGHPRPATPTRPVQSNPQ